MKNYATIIEKVIIMTTSSIRNTSIWILVWIYQLCDVTKADVVCDSPFGYPVRYCYGITAYCCGVGLQECCWQKIWKVWWFWVVAFVIVTAIFSCCGYYCSSTAESGRYGILRSDSFNVFHRFRRFSSDYSPATEEEWKPPDVALPPYSPTPSPSTSRGGGGASTVDRNPPQNMPYLEPPPPYSTVPTHPQPESQDTSPLIPPDPVHSSNDQSNRPTTSVTSH